MKNNIDSSLKAKKLKLRSSVTFVKFLLKALLQSSVPDGGETGIQYHSNVRDIDALVCQQIIKNKLHE